MVEVVEEQPVAIMVVVFMTSAVYSLLSLLCFLAQLQGKVVNSGYMSFVR